MKLSVIIPYHKNVRLLARACSSVGNQIDIHDINIEIIISIDGPLSPLYIRNYIRPFLPASIDLLVVTNLLSAGPGNNRHSAISVSSGQFLAFLDADDYWLHKSSICS